MLWLSGIYVDGVWTSSGMEVGGWKLSDRDQKRKNEPSLLYDRRSVILYRIHSALLVKEWRRNERIW